MFRWAEGESTGRTTCRFASNVCFDMERGGVANVSTISLGSHTGAHLDAPLHTERRRRSSG